MECERFVGTGIASNTEREKCKAEVIHTKRKRKTSMTRAFSKNSSNRESLQHNDENITLLGASRSKFEGDEKGESNDILNHQDKSSTTTLVNGKFENDNGQPYGIVKEEINQVTI